MVPIVTPDVQFRFFHVVDLLAALNICYGGNAATLEEAFQIARVPAQLHTDVVGNVTWRTAFAMTMSPEALQTFLQIIAPFAGTNSVMYYQDQSRPRHAILEGKKVLFHANPHPRFAAQPKTTGPAPEHPDLGDLHP